VDRRSQALTAGMVVLLGVGVLALGFVDDESGVRFVSDLHDEPAAYVTGSYTLIGQVQPATLPHETETGRQPNPEWLDSISWEGRTIVDDVTYRTIHDLAARAENGTIHWILTKSSQRTDRSAPEGTPEIQEWTSQGVLFQVADFETGQRLWAVTTAAPGELFVKPSQMEGHLAAEENVPSGAMVFEVESMAQQCSSKFVPEDLRDEYDQDGDGVTDLP
jgi:hypothetical protein